MYSISDSYSPFLRSFVDSIRKNNLGATDIGSSHAYEIAAAYFGFKSYASAKDSGLDKKIGIIHESETKHCTNIGDLARIQVNPTLARERIKGIRPQASELDIADILSRLNNSLKNEADRINGFIARMHRQLTDLYEERIGAFSGSVHLIYADWIIAGEIASSDNFIGETYTHLPWPEIQAIAVTTPMPVGDRLYPINVDVIVNILNFINPFIIESITDR